MQQRLAIAQALILKPKILLLDEPFGALDPGIRNDMHELITRLWRETGMTVFMVTHDIGEAFKLGTRVLAFDRVRRDPQAPRCVRRHDHLRPQGLQLARRLPQPWPPATERRACRPPDAPATPAREPPRRSPPELSRSSRSQGWKAIEAEGKLSGGRLAQGAAMGARHGPAGLPRA